MLTHVNKFFHVI